MSKTFIAFTLGIITVSALFLSYIFTGGLAVNDSPTVYEAKVIHYSIQNTRWGPATTITFQYGELTDLYTEELCFEGHHEFLLNRIYKVTYWRNWPNPLRTLISAEVIE